MQLRAHRLHLSSAVRTPARTPSRSIPIRHASSTSFYNSPGLRNTLGALALLASGAAVTAYYLDSRSAIHRYVIPPLLRVTLDAEQAHRFAVRTLASGLAPRDLGSDDEKLQIEIWGHRLPNPVSLAAGFDKDAEAIEGLFKLGFGWVEIGSVTPKAQPGNPSPRVFHLSEDLAMINRYGFPSVGFPLVVSRLRSFLSLRRDPSSPQLLSVNVGKNKSSPPESVTDYVEGVRTLGPLADVLVINVSSPNTPGLRGLQTRGLLVGLLTAARKERDAIQKREIGTQGFKWERPKLVVKIAPDLNEVELQDIADVVLETGIDGVIVSNTTIQRPPHLISGNAEEKGGLSGAPLLPLSLSALRTLRAYLPASVPIFGCGGISTGADALEFARSGASAVQLYTSFGYGGPGVPRRIKDEIVSELAKEGTTWEAVAIPGHLREEVLMKEGEKLRRAAEKLKAID
ncbi:hypothetical protein BS47DRAFT_1373329 [Hydnum rufescens UP504]|uniref:Dihydroorotate dehydrogenase (quinone), mitochondrial n=1 Tax=Hydnum rufescens UP504 TaxID=1448309 RepID=A0A9P6ARN4_9AGAM|nr:hypothetical protein BS47DRAFT_1373329 [Hydnum rufescens UP504]